MGSQQVLAYLYPLAAGRWARHPRRASITLMKTDAVHLGLGWGTGGGIALLENPFLRV